jgi:hypothetical protein
LINYLVVSPIAAITIYWPCLPHTAKTVTTPQDTEAPQVSPIKIQIIHWHYCRIIVIRMVKVKVNVTLVVGLINNDDIEIL